MDPLCCSEWAAPALNCNNSSNRPGRLPITRLPSGRTSASSTRTPPHGIHSNATGATARRLRACSWSAPHVTVLLPLGCCVLGNEVTSLARHGTRLQPICLPGFRFRIAFGRAIIRPAGCQWALASLAVGSGRDRLPRSKRNRSLAAANIAGQYGADPSSGYGSQAAYAPSLAQPQYRSRAIL